MPFAFKLSHLKYTRNSNIKSFNTASTKIDFSSIIHLWRIMFISKCISQTQVPCNEVRNIPFHFFAVNFLLIRLDKSCYIHLYYTDESSKQAHRNHFKLKSSKKCYILLLASQFRCQWAHKNNLQVKINQKKKDWFR